MNTTMNHQLISSGAAFDDDGGRLFSNTTSGMGRAKCSCGWMSEVVEFGRARKELHADHKADSEALALELSGLIEEELLEGSDEETFAPKDSPAFQLADKFWPELGLLSEDALGSPDELAEETVEAPEPEVLEGEERDVATIRVLWPETVAKLFWKTLAKDGAKIIADAYGLERISNESRGILEIKGKLSDAIWLSDQLPGVFNAANNALKLWRKNSTEYKAHDLKTSNGRKTAFAAEQNFLRTFCHAVAGTFTDDMKDSPGFEDGITYLGTQEA